MFVTLLVVTLAVAVLVSFGVAALFRRSLRTILTRILSPELGRTEGAS
jgi:putative solute:sodium symporter small subunit